MKEQNYLTIRFPHPFILLQLPLYDGGLTHIYVSCILACDMVPHHWRQHHVVRGSVLYDIQQVLE